MDLRFYFGKIIGLRAKNAITSRKYVGRTHKYFLGKSGLIRSNKNMANDAFIVRSCDSFK